MPRKKSCKFKATFDRILFFISFFYVLYFFKTWLSLHKFVSKRCIRAVLS